MTTAVSSKKQYRTRLARDTKCCASLQKQVSLAHFVLQFAFTKVSLGNSNLPTARDLLRQAEATLTKAITAYLDVNEASNVNLNASMMNGWATNCVFLACNCSFFFTRTFPWDHPSQKNKGQKLLATLGAQHATLLKFNNWFAGLYKQYQGKLALGREVLILF